MSTELQKIDAKKSLGQHFLNNKHIPKLMTEAASVVAGDIVLEIGPGTGVLTREILAQGATVIGIETDERAIEALQKSFSVEIQSGQLTVHHDDIRTLDVSKYGLKEHEYKLVANIPYYLSGHLFRSFLESKTQPSTLVFLVQKEVAERIARDPKESLLSLSVKAFGDPKYIKTIKRGNFSPPPKIDSAIIAITNISHNRFHDTDEEKFFEILHLGFAAKRKQLLGNLAKKYDRTVLTHIFSTLKIETNTRGEDLGIEKWLTLAHELAIHR